MIKLLLVEDDANLRYIIRGGLEDMIGGYEIKDAANGEEGLKVWQEWQPFRTSKCRLWMVTRW